MGGQKCIQKQIIIIKKRKILIDSFLNETLDKKIVLALESNYFSNGTYKTYYFFCNNLSLYSVPTLSVRVRL